MRLTLEEHKGYKDDDGIVHHVQMIRGEDEGAFSYRYPVVCKGAEVSAQHCFYTSLPVTCLECLAAYQPGFIKCTRAMCRFLIRLEQAWIHSQSRVAYCAECAMRINKANDTPFLVVLQT